MSKHKDLDDALSGLDYGTRAQILATFQKKLERAVPQSRDPNAPKRFRRYTYECPTCKHTSSVSHAVHLAANRKEGGVLCSYCSGCSTDGLVKEATPIYMKRIGGSSYIVPDAIVKISKTAITAIDNKTRREIGLPQSVTHFNHTIVEFLNQRGYETVLIT